MVVQPTLLYVAECWPIKKTQVQRMMVAEMRMIRWMCGYTRLDRIRNVVIRERERSCTSRRQAEGAKTEMVWAC